MSKIEKCMIAVVILLSLGFCGYQLAYSQKNVGLLPTVGEYSVELEKEPVTSTEDSGNVEEIEAEEIPEEPVEEVPRIVNLNTATLTELDSLPNIGEQRARDIVEYRTTNGGFQTIEEIMEISGIGEGIFAELKDLITVE